MSTTHHRWPHLPAAPWRYIGSSREVFQAVPGDPSCPLQPGGSCDHCGTGIYEHHHFVATKTGERFKVGSTCVGKMVAQDKDSRSLGAAQRAARKIRNAKARERSAAKREAANGRAVALLADVRDAAESAPHPQVWRAEKGDSLADWADWMLSNGGGPATKRVIAALEGLPA